MLIGMYVTHGGLVAPYGDTGLDSHCLGSATWRHHVITWGNVCLSSVRSFGIHPEDSLQEML